MSTSYSYKVVYKLLDRYGCLIEDKKIMEGMSVNSDKAW